jgi:hypothetical protein
MADQLYLSYWIRGFAGGNMLRQFEKLLRLFPYSRLSRRAASLRIYAGQFAEPPLAERSYPQVDPTAILADARHALSPDAAFIVDAAWDLWQFDEDWHLAPSSVQLIAYGPEFDNPEGDNLRVEFGIDANFLPQSGVPNPLYMAKSNIQGLLHFTHQLDDELDPERRRLWTETGENFAERLAATLAQAG